MNDERTEWLSRIRELRTQILQFYAQESFAEGDKLKELLAQMERHAASRGWKIPE